MTTRKNAQRIEEHWSVVSFYKNEGDIQNCANYGAIKLGESSRAMLVIRTKCFGGTNLGGAEWIFYKSHLHIKTTHEVVHKVENKFTYGFIDLEKACYRAMR